MRFLKTGARSLMALALASAWAAGAEDRRPPDAWLAMEPLTVPEGQDFTIPAEMFSMPVYELSWIGNDVWLKSGEALRRAAVFPDLPQPVAFQRPEIKTFDIATPDSDSLAAAFPDLPQPVAFQRPEIKTFDISTPDSDSLAAAFPDLPQPVAFQRPEIKAFEIAAPDLAASKFLASFRLDTGLPPAMSGAGAFNARLARSARLEQMDAKEAEGWLRVCAERMAAVDTAPADRNMFAERAWDFWRRAYPNQNAEAFATWLDEAVRVSEGAKILLLARLANTNGDHARCRDLLRPRIENPAFAEHRAEMLLLLGMAETQLDDPAAEKTLKRLIDEYPESTFILRGRMLLAWVYMMDGREKEAAEHLRLLLAANPDEALARRARQILAGMEEKEKPAQQPAPAPVQAGETEESADVF